MQPHANTANAAARRLRPKTLTVFAAAFIAGAVLAYGVDRVVDIHVVQIEPQVESEPIFVALRSLPQGAPVTIWDVALKDWPKAMLPTTALKADASFDGMVLRHPIREGQPLLSVQLVRDGGFGPATSVVALPSVASPGGELPRQSAGSPVTGDPPAAAERFVPATPAAAVAPAEVAAAEVAPPAAHAQAQAQATDGPAGVVPPPTSPGTDIDPLPQLDAALTAVTDVVDGTEPTGDPVAETMVDAGPTITDESVVAAETVEVPEPVATPDSMEPTSVATASNALAMTAAAEPLPLAAPVPALPSTDIGGALADVGRASRGGEPAASSVLDRSMEPLPATSEQQLPKQHLVIPERIALAVDASFTQQPHQPQEPAAEAAADEGVRTGAPQARGSASATAASVRAGGRQPASAANPAARQPARNPRQPAAKATKTPSPAARFWNAWFPQASGNSRQR